MTLNLFICSSVKAYKFQNNRFSLVSDLVINPSIICLTEVLQRNRKLEYNKEMYNLTGYVIVDSLLKGRGICLYCKPEFKYNAIKNISEFEEAVACEFIGQT